MILTLRSKESQKKWGSDPLGHELDFGISESFLVESEQAGSW